MQKVSKGLDFLLENDIKNMLKKNQEETYTYFLQVCYQNMFLS